MKRYSQVPIIKLANGTPLPETQKAKAIAACNKGNDLCNEKNYIAALEKYDEAISLSPRHTDAYYNKALLLVELGRRTEALILFDKAIELSPEDPQIYYYKGNVLYIGLSRYEDAIECYNDAIRSKKEYGPAYYGKGQALRDSGRDEEAVIYYDKAILLGYELCNAYGNKGSSLSSLGRYEEAIACYNKALELEPDDILYLCNKGMALKNMQKPIEALECFNKAFELGNQSGSAVGLSEGNVDYIVSVLKGDRIELLQKASEFQKASEETRQQLETLDPNNEDVKKAKEEFKAIEDQGKDLLTSALDSLTNQDVGSADLTTTLSLLMAELAQNRAEIAALKEANALHGYAIAALNSKMDNFSIQLGIQRDTVNNLMLEMEGFGVTKDAVAELMPFLGSLKTIIHQHESYLNHNAVLDSIRSNPYKSRFDDVFRKSLTSTYLAASSVQTDIINTDKKGLVGKFGTLLKSASNYVPVFGFGVHLLGSVLGMLDQFHQEKLLKNYANFASSPSEMEHISSNLSIILVDDRLPKAGIEENNGITALISNIIHHNRNEDAAGNQYSAYRDHHTKALNSTASDGGGSHGGNNITSPIVRVSAPPADPSLGESHAKILSTYVIGMIFDGTVTNADHNELRCVVSITEGVCNRFGITAGHTPLDMSDLMEGCVLFMGDCTA